MARTRTRIVYRDRPVRVEHWFSSITIGQIKQWIYVMAPIVVGIWVFAGPYVDAKAGEYLKGQLFLIGMDPATVQVLNKNLMDLQAQVQQRDVATQKLSEDVSDLKALIGTVLELQKLQVVKGVPPVAEPAK